MGVTTSPQAPASGQRELHVDAMRGIAASMVALFHCSVTAYNVTGGDFRASPLHFGWLGVHVFFVISGYVVAGLALRGATSAPGEFFARRLLRLYPPYLVAVAATILVALLAGVTPGFRGSPLDLGAERLGCHLALSCDITGVGWFDPVFWTLAVEVQFYVLAAIVMAAFRWFGRWAVLLALASSLALAPFVPKFVALHFAGIFIFGIAAKAHRFRMISTVRLALIVIASLMSMIMSLEPAEVVASLIAFACLLVPWRLVPRPLVWLGTISYSLYLLHVPVGGRVLNLLFRIDTSIAFAIAAVAFALVVSVLASAIFWRIIERPAIEWSHQFRRRPALRTTARVQD